MTQTNLAHNAELERQQLVKQAHCLVAAIASRPGSVKLLRGVIPMLEIYAGYKKRSQQRERSVG